VPRATLYRHLRALISGDTLEVVEENPIRGTVKRVFALKDVAPALDPKDRSDMSAGEYED